MVPGSKLQGIQSDQLGQSLKQHIRSGSNAILKIDIPSFFSGSFPGLGKTASVTTESLGPSADVRAASPSRVETEKNVSEKRLLTESAVDPQVTLSPLGAVTATLVTFLLSSQGAHKIKHVFDYESVMFGAIIMVMLIVTLPLFAVFAVYRSIVFCLLKMRSHTFISIMKGPDAIWNLEDPSQPIITVLAEIEADGAVYLLKAIREAVLKAALDNPKLTWKRKYSCLGYSYWQTCSDLSFLKEHVRWMPNGKQNLEDCISLSELQIFISNIAHQGFLEDNNCWEILVSRQRLIMANGELSLVYPVLFRIHHSLGDGVSLLELLMNSLSSVSNKQPHNNSCTLNNFLKCEEKIESTNELENVRDQKNLNGFLSAEENNVMKSNHAQDKCTLQQTKVERERKKNINQIKYKRTITEVFISEGRIEFGSNQIVSYHQQKPALFSLLLEKVNYLVSFASNLQHVKTIVSSLKNIKKSCETSLLDASNISGKKLIAWHTDSSQGSTFFQVKEIKSKVKGVRFTDVVLTAISRTIRNHLKDKNAFIPNCISVVVPIYTRPHFKYCDYKQKSNVMMKTIQNECKITLESQKKSNIEDYENDRYNKLKNSFSLGILNLPVKTVYKTTYISHLKKVAHNMNLMHESGQFELNSFILKWIANLLPAPLLNKFLQIVGHNSMVISNLVGPTDILFIAGYPLRNIYFWVPQRNNTAISISILSYCNRLQLGLMIDRTIMNTAEEVQCFLDQVVTEVTKLAEQNVHETGTGAYF